MENRHLCKAKRTDYGEWIYGYLIYDVADSLHRVVTEREYSTGTSFIAIASRVCEDTICWCTGLKDRKGKLIYENDVVKLVLPDGEIRYFKVSFKKVIRQVVSHSGFIPDVAKVELNAICFEWNGYELFPCVDENGTSDVAKMEVVGNTIDWTKLLKTELLKKEVAMNEDMKVGALTELQGVKEKMKTIIAELARKGFPDPKGFSTLEQYIEDRAKELLN